MNLNPKHNGTCYDKFVLIVIIIICFVIISILNLYKFQIHINQSNEINENQIYNDFGVYSNNMENTDQSENIELLANHNSLNYFYEKVIQFELEKQVIGLGDGGEPAELIGEAKERGDSQISTIAMNKELSDHISYNRTLLDVRNSLCKNRKYDFNNLPTTSVIIIYYNEPYSVILRTVHSVLRTADERILKEIILVDDGSTNVEIKGKLHYYVKTRFPKKVKILKLIQRQGLIRARMSGARLAIGDILLFLDAHCECIIGWLEPLVDRIRVSRTSVVTPIIDIINATFFSYINIKHIIGGFNWNGYFDWIPIQKTEIERINRECVDTCSIRSPTMIGGIFAINRKYFWEMGGYDEEMKGWGGENLEMSFRIWQCGGSIETIVCSRVSHISQQYHHYKVLKSHAINTIRMAKVWMDEYINIFYMINPKLKDNYKIGNITNRKLLREKLKCKSFKWYLKNVYPEKFIPTKNVQGYGHFRSTNLCLDDLQQYKNDVFKLGVSRCYQDKNSLSQFFSLTIDGILRTEFSCAVTQEKSEMKFVVMKPCIDEEHITDFWSYLHGNLIHIKTGLCLDSNGLQNEDFVQLKPCKRKSEAQKWFIEH